MLDFSTICSPTRVYLVVRTQTPQKVPGYGTFYKEYCGEFLLMPDKCPEHMEKFLACWPTRKTTRGEIPQSRFFAPAWQEETDSAVVRHYETKKEYIRVAFTEATECIYRWTKTGIELTADERRRFIQETKKGELKPTIITFAIDSILDSCLV